MTLNKSSFVTLIWLLLALAYLLGSHFYQARYGSEPQKEPQTETPTPPQPAIIATATPTPNPFAAMVFIPYPSQQGFYLDRYEVTVAEYVAFLNTKVAQLPECQGYDCFKTDKVIYEPRDLYFYEGEFHVSTGAENRPVMGVSWAMAAAYCRWLHKRLPTDVEWLWAAQEGTDRRYPWGDAWDAARASRLGLLSSGRVVLEVGSNPVDVTAAGVYDLLGGVNEWVQDWEKSSYEPNEFPASFTGLGTDLPHINRGLFAHDPKTGFLAKSVGPNAYVGIRCADDP